jgi:hypothetical protein
MRKMSLLILSTLMLLGSTLLSAQATRTWVSGVGDDANPCSRTAPCKTFAGAISKTAPGGEIDALDPGGFGALTITKSITLDGGGGQVASVLVAGTNGIVVAAGATDVVIIRNLRLDGLLGNGNPNAGLSGIKLLSAKALHIEHCTIFGFSQNGIDIESSTPAKIFVVDTFSTNNASAGLVSFSSGSTSTSIVGSRFEDNLYGVFDGTNGSSSSVIDIKDSDISGNGTGIVANTSVDTVHIADVSLFNNGNTYSTSGGSILSFGNNYNSGSGAPSGPASPGPQ